ncbi:MAG: ABC transporter permease [bacterium]
MSKTIAIFKREFAGYFNSPIAYIYVTVFIGLSCWLFFKDFFVVGEASLRSFFGLVPWLFLFFIPAITMRLWAEEKKVGTVELLMTLPVSNSQAVLGKFLASFVFLLISLAMSLVIPIVVSILGNPDPGEIVGGYLGLLLLGAAFLSIGIFFSSLTENQIVAFIISVVAIFILLVVGDDFIVLTIPTWIARVFKVLGLGVHFDSISRGVVDSRDIIYYLTVVGFFLYLNVKSIQARR